MELSLIQLSLLIELTSKEISRLKDIIDNPNSSDDEVDDCGELAMQYLALASTLAEIYKSMWSEGCGEPIYEELIKNV